MQHERIYTQGHPAGEDVSEAEQRGVHLKCTLNAPYRNYRASVVPQYIYPYAFLSTALGRHASVAVTESSKTQPKTRRNNVDS